MQLCLALALVGCIAVSDAFLPASRAAGVSTARYLFGTPEPKKDEIKKDGGGLGGMFGGVYSFSEPYT